MEQIVEILDAASKSEHAALLIALSAAFVLGWGWWRRELMHLQRYDKIREEHNARVDVLMKTIDKRDEEIANLGREAFSTLSEISGALAGMERTLECLDALTHGLIESRLKDGEKR